MSNIFKLVTHIGDKDIRQKEPDGQYHKKAVEYRKKMMAQKLSPTGKIILKKARMLSPEEQKEKAKKLFAGVKPHREPSEQEKRDYQKRVGKAYSE